MTRPCGVTDTDLQRFTDGGAVELENHVAGCEHCHAALDEIWSSAFDRDLAPAVLRTLEFDEFVKDAVGLAAGIGASLMRAVVTYLGVLGEDER